ncbi:MAG: PTS sugar transporter subunit IIA [Pseudomonadota bacterium]
MVGVLLVTHARIGDALLDTARTMLGPPPLATEVLPVPQDCDPERITAEARERRARVDGGNGVLVLTDMYGSTPSNIAHRLLDDGDSRVVAGVNLPMLVRVFNYATLDLSPLADKAVSGGHDGIVQG